MTHKILKRTSLLVITILLVFSFSGCGVIDKIFHREPPSQPTQESTITTMPTTTAPSTTEPTTTPTTIPTTAPTTSEITGEEMKVWAKQDINVREKPTVNSTKLGVLHEGNAIIRTGKTSDGWSKVIFNGNEAYVSTSHLTEKEPAKMAVSDRIVVDPDTDLWYLVIVNYDREMPADYVPVLAEIASSGKYLDSRVAPYFNEMYAAAKKDGITLTPYSAYRSYARQLRNYNNLTETYMSRYNLSREEAAKKAATVILPPGTSEHNLGLAVDICNTNASFSSQKEYKWLTEHAHEYGFILRYTAEKQSITGIIPEPWHWRYVGVELAKDIKDSGLCLEEYLQQAGIAY